MKLYLKNNKNRVIVKNMSPIKMNKIIRQLNKEEDEIIYKNFKWTLFLCCKCCFSFDSNKDEGFLKDNLLYCKKCAVETLMGLI